MCLPESRRLLATVLAALALPVFARAQEVTGTVIDGQGEPLIGVNVLVSGTQTGTVTDYDGLYAVSANPEDTLIFRYIGFAEDREAVGDRAQIDVTMGEDARLLDEVVVVGYGVQKRSDVTGSIGSVEQDEITRVATPSVTQALQGKVAGVQVTPASGTPGDQAVIRVRGVGTLNNANPLYVVDGMLTDDISFLNPNDVERIDVLKDASASAIYGSRGANGVILITTRKGDADGNSVINVDVYTGRQSLPRKIDLANAGQFAELSNELARNEDRAIPYPDSADYDEGTDWQDAVFRRAPITSYQVSASGGDERGSYLVSGNYFDQEGILRGGKFDRSSVRFNADYELRPKVTVGQNLAFTLQRTTNGPGLVDQAYQGYPTLPLRDSVGGFANTSPVGNVLASLEYQNSTNKEVRFLGNAYVNYEPIDGLNVRSSFGLDRSNGSSQRFTPVFFVSPQQQNLQNDLSVGETTVSSWLWENTATYKFAVGENSAFTVLGGVTAQNFRTEALGGSVQDLPDEAPETRYLSNGDPNSQTNFSNAGEWSLLSYLARVNYAYADRYLLTASVRADGSSRFGANNRYGYFPSGAVAWRIDREPFFPQGTALNRLKVRAGYGAVGNDKIGFYPSVPTVTTNLNPVFGREEALVYGASIVALANPNLRWESAKSVDVGLEAGLLDDRITLEVEYYSKTTTGILLQVPLPDYIGVESVPFVNAADVRNSGFEVNVGYRDKAGPVNYSVSANGSTVENEVLSLGEGSEFLLGGNVGVGGLLATRTEVGSSVGAFYGYEVLGVFQDQAEVEANPNRGVQAPGDLKFADTNGDGVITDEDRTELGSPIPDFIFGASVGFDVAGFDVAVDFNGQVGNEILNAKRMSRFNTYNFESVYLDRWNGPGTSDSEPRITNGGVNYEVSQRFLRSGDYVRLRNLTLGYTLPQNVLARVRLNTLRVYASATNLVLWDSYPGYTPEVITDDVLASGIDRGVYPVPRTLNAGVQLGF